MLGLDILRSRRGRSAGRSRKDGTAKVVSGLGGEAVPVRVLGEISMEGGAMFSPSTITLPVTARLVGRPAGLNTYDELRATAGASGNRLALRSSTDPRIDGVFVFADHDPYGKGDDGGMVLKGANGWWVRQFAHDRSDPIRLDWFQLADGHEITALLDNVTAASVAGKLPGEVGSLFLAFPSRGVSRLVCDMLKSFHLLSGEIHVVAPAPLDLHQKKYPWVDLTGAQWTEVNDQGTPTAGTKKWRTPVEARVWGLAATCANAWIGYGGETNPGDSRPRMWGYPRADVASLDRDGPKATNVMSWVSTETNGRWYVWMRCDVNPSTLPLVSINYHSMLCMFMIGDSGDVLFDPDSNLSIYGTRMDGLTVGLADPYAIAQPYRTEDWQLDGSGRGSTHELDGNGFDGRPATIAIYRSTSGRGRTIEIGANTYDSPCNMGLIISSKFHGLVDLLKVYGTHNDTVVGYVGAVIFDVAGGRYLTSKHPIGYYKEGGVWRRDVDYAARFEQGGTAGTVPSYLRGGTTRYEAFATWQTWCDQQGDLTRAGTVLPWKHEGGGVYAAPVRGALDRGSLEVNGVALRRDAALADDGAFSYARGVLRIRSKRFDPTVTDRHDAGYVGHVVGVLAGGHRVMLHGPWQKVAANIYSAPVPADVPDRRLLINGTPWRKVMSPPKADGEFFYDGSGSGAGWITIYGEVLDPTLTDANAKGYVFQAMAVHAPVHVILDDPGRLPDGSFVAFGQGKIDLQQDSSETHTLAIEIEQTGELSSFPECMRVETTTEYDKDVRNYTGAAWTKVGSNRYELTGIGTSPIQGVRLAGIGRASLHRKLAASAVLGPGDWFFDGSDRGGTLTLDRRIWLADGTIFTADMTSEVVLATSTEFGYGAPNIVWLENAGLMTQTYEDDRLASYSQFTVYPRAAGQRCQGIGTIQRVHTGCYFRGGTYHSFHFWTTDCYTGNSREAWPTVGPFFSIVAMNNVLTGDEHGPLKLSGAMIFDKGARDNIIDGVEFIDDGTNTARRCVLIKTGDDAAGKPLKTTIEFTNATFRKGDWIEVEGDPNQVTLKINGETIRFLYGRYRVGGPPIYARLLSAEEATRDTVAQLPWPAAPGCAAAALEPDPINGGMRAVFSGSQGHLSGYREEYMPPVAQPLYLRVKIIPDPKAPDGDTTLAMVRTDQGYLLWLRLQKSNANEMRLRTTVYLEGVYGNRSIISEDLRNVLTDGREHDVVGFWDTLSGVGGILVDGKEPTYTMFYPNNGQWAGKSATIALGCAVGGSNRYRGKIGLFEYGWGLPQ